MKSAVLTSLSLAAALLGTPLADATGGDAWRLPKNQPSYLMEDDLVNARFLMLARGGTYQQINRDARGSAEVDRGRWEQEIDGTLRLRSSCRALRPRALKSGPLSVIIASQDQLDTLPQVLAAMRHLLAEYGDGVFDAGTAAEINSGAAAVQVEVGAATFERADVLAFMSRITETLESERDGAYSLRPVKSAQPPLFILSGGSFQETDLAEVRRTYRPGAGTTPFYFVRIPAAVYAREVGHWHTLHMPGSAE